MVIAEFAAKPCPFTASGFPTKPEVGLMEAVGFILKLAPATALGLR